MSSLQIVAFVSGLAGLGATIGATVSNEWKATSRASSVITAVCGTTVLEMPLELCTADHIILSFSWTVSYTGVRISGRPQSNMSVLTLLSDTFVSVNG